ncbi:MAG TPA: SPOR domain-containing protein [Acidobacteriaceae bacterium]|nr:SPOR domain-containing protein [Acidobacteriaceae bacterium]
MSFLFDTQEEKETRRSPRYTATPSRAADNDTEIALGTRSLLAIFFGLVLICAVFFGLGYSVGRGSGTRAAAAPPSDVSTLPDSHLSKPSPEQTLTPVETPPPSTSDTDDGSSPAAESGTAEARTPNSAPAPPATLRPSPSPAAETPLTAPSAKPAALQPAAATLATAFMVQVAAVRVPQDAQILVDALKKRGYSAAARNEPQDQLLHIQLGPFTSRSDAIAMRAKLLTDGYNAVIK